MILIRKNSVNNNILTLSEKTTLNNVVYLFEIINDQTKNNIYFIAQDISGNKERFNEFNITDFVNSTIGLQQSLFIDGQFAFINFTDEYPLKKRDESIQLFASVAFTV